MIAELVQIQVQDFFEVVPSSAEGFTRRRRGAAIFLGLCKFPDWFAKKLTKFSFAMRILRTG